MAVIGVGRFIQQRQDFEDSIAASYQAEMTARVQLAEHPASRQARARVLAERARRNHLQDQISSDTRETALLVAGGLVAGLAGAVLLFSGLIASLRRPLEDLVDAAGRLAAGDRTARVTVGGLSETATLGAAFNEMAAELEREASQRDQLDRLKDEFVLTASHELRSPLTSVQGFAELLMLDRDSLTPKQVETVQIILDNCRHLVRLLNDLLVLARSDAGRLSIQPRPTPLAPLIEDVVRTLRAQTGAKQQTLTERLDPGLPLVEIEADRIRQILVNLLTNAHEYSPEGASIEVTARTIGAEVEVCVSDNGPGIPEAQLEHVFERFTRGDAGLTQRVGGTGLGLAISKSLVELHGGTISVDSVVGQGSTFAFRLPVSATVVQAGDPALKEAG
jgi:signal transduction histidine kinase